MRAAAARQGYEVTGEIAQPHVRPWSTVFRATTRRGDVYLKCCGPSQAHEPRLTALLSRVAPDGVPTLIARHPRRDWMLLADGGRKVREVYAGEDLLRAWERVLPMYAGIQIALLGREREVLATNTPDCRLETLPSRVAAILDDRGVSRGSPDRLSRDEARRVRSALRVVEARCAELAALGIGPTVEHDDLHDGNVLRRGRRTVVFDWGDACVTHPFLSLTIVLRFAAARARARATDPRIRRLRDAYLEPFARFAPARDLRRGAEIARRLGIITRAACWYRVVTLTGTPDAGNETLAYWLRQIPRAFSAKSGSLSS